MAQRNTYRTMKRNRNVYIPPIACPSRTRDSWRIDVLIHTHAHTHTDIKCGDVWRRLNGPEFTGDFKSCAAASFHGQMSCLVTTSSVSSLRIRLRTFPEISFEAETKRNNPSNDAGMSSHSTRGSLRETGGYRRAISSGISSGFANLTTTLTYSSPSLFILDVFFVFELSSRTTSTARYRRLVFCAPRF